MGSGGGEFRLILTSLGVAMFGARSEPARMGWNGREGVGGLSDSVATTLFVSTFLHHLVDLYPVCKNCPSIWTYRRRRKRGDDMYPTASAFDRIT
jgi:hypothetical protein